MIMPAKPEGSIWSDDQWRAIAESGDDILVAAAAGSGKTAVLVERIIRRIGDESSGFSVDRLLVATFTKAAASEMRQRIREALESRLEHDTDNAHLRRQLALLGRASITTLHSFCLEVIRRYYQLIPLDPGFRILNEHEAEMMRQEILEELFEEKYEEAGEDGVFVQLADWFSGERSDDAVHALVQRLYDFSRSHPWPEKWLRETAECFSLPDTEALSRTPWVRSILDEAGLSLAAAASLLERGRQITLQPGGPAPYADNLTADLEMVEGLRQAVEERNWTELYALFSGASFGKLKPCKKDATDPALQETVKGLRDEVKKIIGELQDSLFGRPADAFLRELHEAAPLMKELAETVILFGERYRAEKAGKGLVDFSDLEHYCLTILRHPDSAMGHSMPSDAAMEYRAQFDEVLLDEYQDTNSVQEEIVRLISREDPGNRFMVGDMKQSIYRFRLAEPGLFLDKYRSYGKGGSKEAHSREGQRTDESGFETASGAEIGEEKGVVIDLARNFRSRMEVVNAVNMLFRQIMNETVAEIAYDERAELVYGANFPGAADNGPDTYFAPELLLIDRGSSKGLPEERPEDGEADSAESELIESETAQLEARAIARRIARMTGMDGGEPLQIFDKGLGAMRPVVYGDIVILLRSASVWAPLMMEELRLEGIPAYGDQNRGYFQATEVEVILSLLKVVDNPRQDIPLAGTLRSPVVGLTEEELAKVRLCAEGSFYDAVIAAVSGGVTDGGSGSAGLEADYSAVAAGVTASGAASLMVETAHTDMKADVDIDGFGEIRDNEADGVYKVRGPAGNAVETAAASETVKAESSATGDTESSGPAISGRLRGKLIRFLDQLEGWRDEARRSGVSGLIWRIYGESGYLEWVGGLPGGAQRQSNLKALYDRAVQFEKDTSARGLFRFLVFISRLRENGGDLGAAGGSGEQGEGVRIMTIHKSKGLEFPVVFLAGMSKGFNRQDLYAPFLMHKELGFGPRFLERETRVSYPTLPYLAIGRRSRLELLAEEMRVLYVGLTRPRDKMILVGTVRDLAGKAASWMSSGAGEEQLLPDHLLARGRSYLDWVGPALIRHPGAAILRKIAGKEGAPPLSLRDDLSNWSVSVLPSYELEAAVSTVKDSGEDGEEARKIALHELSRAVPVTVYAGEKYGAAERLSWSYPYGAAADLPAKTSVTELKSLLSLQDQPSFDLLEEGLDSSRERGSGDSLHLRRPRFMEQRGVTPAERGTVYHTIMQHIPLEGEVGLAEVRETLERLVQLCILTEEQAAAVEPEKAAAFYRHPLGLRLLASPWKRREMPFSYMMPASEAYRGLEALDRAASKLNGESGTASPSVLIQGVIDCLFREEGRLILLDYKSDAVLEHRGGLEALKEKYRYQLGLYSQALGDILGEEIAEAWLYFFDGGHAVRV